MEKKKVLEVYRRYLSSLNNQNADIAINLDAFFNWIDKHTEEELRGKLKVDAIYQTIKAVQRQNISCKQMAGGNWNKDAVQHCYLLLNNLNKALEEDDDTRARVISVSLWKHINSFRSDMPWLYLYMHIAYSKTFAGSWLTKHREMLANHQQLIEELGEEYEMQNAKDDLRLTVQSQIVDLCKTED